MLSVSLERPPRLFVMSPLPLWLILHPLPMPHPLQLHWPSSMHPSFILGFSFLMPAARTGLSPGLLLGTFYLWILARLSCPQRLSLMALPQPQTILSLSFSWLVKIFSSCIYHSWKIAYDSKYTLFVFFRFVYWLFLSTRPSTRSVRAGNPSCIH